MTRPAATLARGPGWPDRRHSRIPPQPLTGDRGVHSARASTERVLGTRAASIDPSRVTIALASFRLRGQDTRASFKSSALDLKGES